jgi:hypothetical protein
MVFDPTQFGATPVQTNQSSGVFDPAKFGATPVQNNISANQPPTPGVFQPHPNFLQKIGSAVGNLGLGVVKGVGSTTSALGTMGESILDQTAGRVVNAATGKGFTKPTDSSTTQGTIDQTLTPNNTAQKIGFGAEKLAEFFVPGGAEADAVNAADKGIEALNLGNKAKSALQIGARAAGGATSTAAVTAAQGSSGEDIKQAGVLGGIAGGLSKPVSDLIRNIPENAWSSILKRTSSQVAKNPNLPEQAAQTGLIGTKGAIAKQSQEAIQTIETHLDGLLSSSKEAIDGTKVSTYLDGLRDTYSNIPGEAHSVAVIDGIKQDLASKGTLTPLEANQVKRDIYSVIAKSYGKGTLEVPAKIEAQKNRCNWFETRNRESCARS